MGAARVLLRAVISTSNRFLISALGHSRRFLACVRSMSGYGVISEMPVVRFCLLKASVSTWFKAPKRKPRIMRYELTDFEWAAIRSFLPNKPRGIPRVDDRRVLNGIFWI